MGWDGGTSTQRTYRYIRISLVAVVVLLGVSLVQHVVADGPLGSISSSFYTPVHNVFVGSLMAVGLALIALSGRSWPQLMLNFAGMLAPVIALVPTPAVPGSMPALPEFDCGAADRCIPKALEPEVMNGVTALLVVGSLVWILVVVLSRSDAQESRLRMRVGIGIAALLLLAAAISFFLFPSTFFAYAHYVATVIFFLLIATVALVSAFEVRRESPTKRRFWLPYLLASVGMIIGVLIVPLSFLVAPSPDTPPFPWVFWGEATALSFFAIFWALQTVEKWRDINPLRLA